MTNNDILKRIRYAFDFSNSQAVKFFSLDPSSSSKMNKEGFIARTMDELEEKAIACSDYELNSFLDGFIVSKRGLREGDAAAKKTDSASFRLSKNDVLKKLRIALTLHEKEMLSTLALGGSALSKAELSALFRSPSHKHFRTCGNQVLRNFIKGLTLQNRPESAEKTS